MFMSDGHFDMEVCETTVTSTLALFFTHIDCHLITFNMSNMVISGCESNTEATLTSSSNFLFKGEPIRVKRA